MGSHEDGKDTVPSVCVYARVCVCMHSVIQSCPTLCNLMDHSLPGSSVHGIFQARIQEWVVISSSRGSSWPRDQICISCVSCIAGGFYTVEPWVGRAGGGDVERTRRFSLRKYKNWATVEIEGATGMGETRSCWNKFTGEVCSLPGAESRQVGGAHSSSPD